MYLTLHSIALPTPDAKPLLCGVSVSLCGGSELLAGAWETGRKRVGWRSVDLWASGADCLWLGQ